MSWINEVDVSEADGKLAEMYAALIKQRGKVSNILKVHSLNPEAMGNHLDLYMTLMFGKSGLSRAEREAIAVVVSANNDCEYCVAHHLEALKHYIDDAETLDVAERRWPRNARTTIEQYRATRREADERAGRDDGERSGRTAIRGSF